LHRLPRPPAPVAGLSPDSPRELRPPAVPSDPVFGLRRELDLPALPPTGPPAFTGRLSSSYSAGPASSLRPRLLPAARLKRNPRLSPDVASSTFTGGLPLSFARSLVPPAFPAYLPPARAGCRLLRFHWLTSLESHGILVSSARPAACLRLAPVVLPSGTSSFNPSGLRRLSLPWPGL